MKEWTGKAIVGNIPKVKAFVDEQLVALTCPSKARLQIKTAIDELFGNIVSYAYGDTPGDAVVHFDFDDAERLVVITFVDHGIPFNPLQKPEPDTSLAIEDRKIGGLGIFIVRKTMDDLIYVRENDRNVLTLRKRI